MTVSNQKLGLGNRTFLYHLIRLVGLLVRQFFISIGKIIQTLPGMQLMISDMLSIFLYDQLSMSKLSELTIWPLQ